jgi:hypothetical protein
MYCRVCPSRSWGPNMQASWPCRCTTKRQDQDARHPCERNSRSIRPGLLSCCRRLLAQPQYMLFADHDDEYRRDARTRSRICLDTHILEISKASKQAARWIQLALNRSNKNRLIAKGLYGAFLYFFNSGGVTSGSPILSWLSCLSRYCSIDTAKVMQLQIGKEFCGSNSCIDTPCLAMHACISGVGS